MGGRIAFAVVLCSSVASADDAPKAPKLVEAAAPMDKLWPAVPEYHGLSTEDVMTDNLSDIGNVIAGHLDLLSHDIIGLHVDGRAQRARLRVGGGDERYLKLKIDSSWLFADGKARVSARVDLCVHGHELQVKLPEMDLSHDNYRGEGLVQVNVPLLERQF